MPRPDGRVDGGTSGGGQSGSCLSFTVSQCTREIGIRTALGARASSIVSTIGQKAALQLGTGVVLGGGLAWFLSDEITAEFGTLTGMEIPTR